MRTPAATIDAGDRLYQSEVVGLVTRIGAENLTGEEAAAARGFVAHHLLGHPHRLDTAGSALIFAAGYGLHRAALAYLAEQ